MERVFWVLLRYEVLVAMGLGLAILALLNVLHVTDLDSDFFWFIAGIGLCVEALIEIFLQRTPKIAPDQSKSKRRFRLVRRLRRGT